MTSCNPRFCQTRQTGQISPIWTMVQTQPATVHLQLSLALELSSNITNLSILLHTPSLEPNKGNKEPTSKTTIHFIQHLHERYNTSLHTPHPTSPLSPTSTTHNILQASSTHFQNNITATKNLNHCKSGTSITTPRNLNPQILQANPVNTITAIKKTTSPNTHLNPSHKHFNSATQTPNPQSHNSPIHQKFNPSNLHQQTLIH